MTIGDGMKDILLLAKKTDDELDDLSELLKNCRSQLEDMQVKLEPHGFTMGTTLNVRMSDIIFDMNTVLDGIEVVRKLRDLFMEAEG